MVHEGLREVVDGAELELALGGALSHTKTPSAQPRSLRIGDRERRHSPEDGVLLSLPKELAEVLCFAKRTSCLAMRRRRMPGACARRSSQEMVGERTRPLGALGTTGMSPRMGKPLRRPWTTYSA